MSESNESELQGLRQRLSEAEATLEAIRDGRVDAIVVDGAEAQQVYALESADLPYRQFLEQMGEGAVSLDAAGNFLFCNRFLSALIGRSPEALFGSPFEALVVAGSREAYRAALRSEQPQRVGVDLHMPDGRELPVQLALTPVGSGARRRTIMVVTDLSERERLRELSQEREIAEAESLAKDHFLATVGHDLRTPLNVVMGWTALLLERRQDYDARTLKALETIDRNARVQVKLIDDLLDVSRIVSGKLSIERCELDLAELTRGLGSALALSAQEKGVELTVIADGPAPVLGDAQRLEQVLNNLICNAIKFTPRGGHVQVRLERSGGRFRIEVRDDGRGLEPSQLPILFQLFRQAAPAQRREGGLGLGLTIVKQLVELHEGRISAHSDGPGKGAVFVVELAALLPGERHARAAGRNVLPFAPPSLRGFRVLVVDDEEEMRDITARALRGFGAEVVCVASVAAALARLESDGFDLVVSDLRMPGTDGFELAREVRQRHGVERPLLAVSGLVGREDVERALSAGFSAHVAKPLDGERLFRAALAAINSVSESGRGAPARVQAAAKP